MPSRHAPLQRTALLALLALLGAAGIGAELGAQSAASLAPGPLRVQAQSIADGKPVVGLVVRLGARHTATDAHGVALFDGVPAGATRLVVAQGGFERIERELVLPAGRREALVLELVPERRINFRGRVEIEGLEIPIAGARIELAPLAVASAVQGTLVFTTDFEGAFHAPKVPVGRWRAELRAAGCRTTSVELELASDEVQQRLALPLVVEEAALDVLVRDASGRGIPHAEIVLAEAHPLRELARERADAEGRRRFAGLKVAARNRADAEGRLTASRRHVTLHAAAEGYASLTVPVTLGSQGAVELELAARRVAEEQEPNDSAATAQAIDLGAEVRNTIARVGDVDWFRFRVPQPGRLTLELGRDSGLATWFQLLDGSGAKVLDRGAYPGQPNGFDLPLRAGEHLLQIGHWGNTAASERLLGFRFEYVAMPDPLAPNATPENARRIRPGEEIATYFLEAREADCFRFVLPRPSAVRFAMPKEPFQRDLELRHAHGASTGKRASAYAGQELVLQAQLDAGEYVLVATEWGKDAAPMQPSTIRFDAIEDDGFDDAGARSVVRTLAPDVLVATTILPLGDVDAFTIDLPSSGTLRVESNSAHEQELRVLDGRGRSLAEGRVYAGQELVLEAGIAAAQSVRLELREWGSDAFSPHPYLLRTLWFPCDEAEAAARNDISATATPFVAGDELRGTFAPLRDVDRWRFDADRAGRLELEIDSPGQIELRVLDGAQRELASHRSYGGRFTAWASVPPGENELVVREWGDDAWMPGSYAIATRLVRADPAETMPLHADPVRTLPLGEARAFRFEHLRDRDRFRVALPAAGKYLLATSGPLQREIRAQDELSGAELFTLRSYAGEQRHEFERKGPTRLLLELREWGEDDCGVDDGLLLVAPAGAALVAEHLVATIDRCDPTLARFARAPWAPHASAVRATLDADGDGRVDLELPPRGEVAFRYAAEGVYAATLHLDGAAGTSTRRGVWIDATGYREKKGVHLLVSSPPPSATVELEEPIRASAISYSGARIARVEASIDGSFVGLAATPPYAIEVPWDRFGPGEHELLVAAIDARGERAERRSRFRVSEFLGLLPEDGAQIAGESVVVAWKGRGFGPAGLRLRKAGTAGWAQTLAAEHARERRIEVPGLEPGVAYELQPLGEGEGPIRTITRVKGLAFERTRYAAAIRRDYNQRLAIRVRNHGEQEARVHLECGRPPEASRLLAGFVGEGSEGEPFALPPGEEREFLLGISAQDCVARQVSFELRLVAEDGRAGDVAIVELDVALPKVELAWEDQGPLPDGLGRRLLLRNLGDTLTDLAVASPSRDLLVTPRLEHALLPAGQALELVARPRLHEGFTAIEAPLVARAIDRAVELPQRFALPEGQQIHAVELAPRSEDARLAARERRAFLAGAHLDPSTVDWTRATQRDDTDGDGRAERFVVDLRGESTRWIGIDHDGDGAIDAAHADVGADGIIDFAALRGASGFEETNLVEAWLEMGFELPWARSAYEPHDADILVNGTAVGKLRDTLPEGNYAFAVPPSALRFGETEAGARNEVRIESKHLRGGHYVVSSDFRMKLRLTGTRVYAAGTSIAEAQKSLLAREGVSVSAPDLSLSSHELRVAFPGEARSGAPIRVTAPLRNLGAAAARDLEVALAFTSGRDEVELARTRIALVPAGGVVPLELHATAPAGNVVLHLRIDPEQRQGDLDRTNDVAKAPLAVAGDAVEPELEITTPNAGARCESPIVELRARATDDVAVARVEVRVGQGLWTALGTDELGFAGRALLQPGAHTLGFRAIDTSGNRRERSVAITVAAPAPTVAITAPAAGTKLEARSATITLACGGDVAAVAVRANGGPWRAATLTGATAKAELPLPFGAVQLEALAVSPLGVRALASRPLECTRQPTAEEPRAATSAQRLDVPGFGTIDPFGAPNPIAAPPSGGARGPLATGDDPGPDGNYGSAPPRGQDPEPFEGLDAEEALLDGPAGDDELLDPLRWLDDPEVDRVEPEELREPAEIEPPAEQPPDLEAWDAMDPPLDADDAVALDSDGEAAAWPAFAPLGASAEGRRAIAIQQRQADWYCTNRPSVGVGFHLPDWLMKLKLPKPGTAEYEAVLRERLEELRSLGFDTSKLEQMRRILQARCARLESPEELPDFLQSLGFKQPTRQDPEALAEWREKMANAADAFLLRLLHSDDPELIAAGLRARLDALGKFDEAAQDSAEAVIETIRANQRITEDVAALVPYLNLALAARGLATGESLGGEQLGTFQRALSALALVGPAAKLLQNPTLRSVAGKLGNQALWVGDATLGRLARQLGVPVDRLRGALRSMGEALGNARLRAGEKLFGKAWAAEQRFLASPAGRRAAELAQQDLRQANALLTRIAQAQAAGDKVDYRRLIGLLQGNKTAQALLNSGRFTNQFRAALDRTHRAMGRLADKRTIAEVLTNPAVQARIRKLARDFGVNADDIVIQARNVSGNVKRLRDLGPRELLKYGADRDVVYQFVTKQGRTLADVHHRLVEPVYARNLQRITGRTLAEMDHVVTSRWHPEAYNAGLNPNTDAGRKAIADIISGRAAGSLRRATDIRDTVIHKGREWMDAGDELARAGQQTLGNQKVREGMRQMLKEYDRQVAQFLQAQRLDPARVLPPRLRQGLEIFRRVRDGAADGSFTVEQAREMLKALTPPGSPPITPQTIADALGTYVEYLNKWGLRNAR